MRNFYFVLVLTIVPLCLQAQPSRLEIGLMGGAAYNAHDASFSKLGTFASCCPVFGSTTSWGPTLGAYVAVPLSKAFRLHARVLTSSEGATMTYDESSFVADLRDSARVVPALFRHALTSSITTIGLEPTITWNPFWTVEVGLGARFGYTATARFSQTETMIEPEDFGSYLGTGRTWVNHAADIPDATALRVGMLAVLRASLPLNQDASLVLAPEVGYISDGSRIAAGVPWRVNQLRATIGLGWRPAPSPPAPPPPVPAPSVPVVAHVPPAPVRPPLTATIRAEGILDDGSRTQQPTITIDEVLTTDLRPLLPYIYFDRGQSPLPERYVQRKSIADFSEAGLHSVGTLDTYHELLNIVGRRLQDAPQATLTITGHVTGVGADTGTVLARSRAETVKQYLVNTWSIASERLTIVARAMPEKPTRAVDPADAAIAEEENRRVELSSTHADILAPVRTADTARSSSVPSIAFDVAVPAGTTIVRWNIRATQGGRLLFQTGGQGDVPSSPVVWNITANPASMPTTDEAIAYTLQLDDVHGSSFQSVPQQISVQQFTIQRKRTEQLEDREVDRFALILFDFNDASVKGQNAEIVKLIQSKIRPESKITIRGSADIIGAEAYNRTLARNRAQETSRVLGLGSRATLATDIGGAAPYPVNLPEGRAYSRTVVVNVETPVR
jgi:outer membrane protein OmpA-like peptidoglycan-associated protein